MKKKKKLLFIPICIIISLLLILPTFADENGDYFISDYGYYNDYAHIYNTDKTLMSYSILLYKDVDTSNFNTNMYSIFSFYCNLCGINTYNLYNMDSSNGGLVIQNQIGSKVVADYYFWHYYDYDNNQWVADNDKYTNLSTDISQNYTNFKSKISIINRLITYEQLNYRMLCLSINNVLFSYIETDIIGMLTDMLVNNYINQTQMNTYLANFYSSQISYNNNYVEDINQNYWLYLCSSTNYQFFGVDCNAVQYKTNAYDFKSSLQFVEDINNWAFFPNKIQAMISTFIVASISALVIFTFTKILKVLM